MVENGSFTPESQNTMTMKLNPPLSRNRSRRRMKKLRIGEFQELGFTLSAEIHKELSPEQQNAFLSAFLDDVIEARGLAYGGGVDLGFVSKFERGSATEEDRQAVKAWYAARPEVKETTVGDLVDCWHEGPQYTA
jgi:uncharacterized protein YggL (DUF469 family)